MKGFISADLGEYVRYASTGMDLAWRWGIACFRIAFLWQVIWQITDNDDPVWLEKRI